MKRVVFIVEGDTEIILIEKLVMPHLVQKGFNVPMNCQTIVTNRKQHKKGGVGSYGKFKNEVIRTLSQGNVIVTSFIDFYKLPSDFPGYTLDAAKIGEIEQAILQDFDLNPDFIPYVQKHETEALMFSDRAGFDFAIDDPKKMPEIDKIITQYPNPEDINNSPETAPSKRLKNIFPYDKTADGPDIFEMIGMEAVLEKCPRFAGWIQKLEQKLSNNH